MARRYVRDRKGQFADTPGGDSFKVENPAWLTNKKNWVSNASGQLVNIKAVTAAQRIQAKKFVVGKKITSGGGSAVHGKPFGYGKPGALGGKKVSKNSGSAKFIQKSIKAK